MKKKKVKKPFLEQLRKLPNIKAACDLLGISRQTVYRWRVEDSDFVIAMDEALSDGEGSVNDMVEGQLLNCVKDKKLAAITFYLSHKHPKYKNGNGSTTENKEIEDLKEITNENIKNQLKNGDIAMTKWFAEKTMPEYSKEAIRESVKIQNNIKMQEIWQEIANTPVKIEGANMLKYFGDKKLVLSEIDKLNKMLEEMEEKEKQKKEDKIIE